MPDNTVQKRKFLQKLRDTYRVTILDEENLEKVGTYHLSLLKFLTFAGTIITLCMAIVISLIIFTPIKRLIPGYGEITENRKFIELVKKVDTLETEVNSYQVYNEALRNLLQSSFSDEELVPDNFQAVLKDNQPERVNQADLKETKRAKELDFLKFATPVFGTVSAGFQPDVQHFGVDVVAPKDTPVKSIMDGIVLSADQSVNTGNSVYIQHSKNVVSVYKHNSVLLVKTGDIIKTGQAIAIIGNTGELSTGPHLHFEMWYDGKYVNPQNYITFQ